MIALLTTKDDIAPNAGSAFAGGWGVFETWGGGRDGGTQV